VLIVEVNVVNSEAAQAGLAGGANVFRLAIYVARGGVVWVANDSELGGEHDLVALAFDRLADQFFVLVRSVDVGGVEEVDAEFEGAVKGGDGFVVVASAVKLGHAHAAESESGNREASMSKMARFHG
jgi:hypothetical protein